MINEHRVSKSNISITVTLSLINVMFLSVSCFIQHCRIKDLNGECPVRIGFITVQLPGLFKVEWSGSGFVGLAAKTYFCFDPDDNQKEKCSTKGINKAAQISIDHFRSVLQTKNSVSSTNRGFILKDNTMLSYAMERSGLSYFYCKRKVLEDGISTTYLDI